MAESRGVGRHKEIILSRGVGVYNIIVLYFYNSGKPFYPRFLKWGVAKSPGQKFKYYILIFCAAEICGAKDPFGAFQRGGNFQAGAIGPSSGMVKAPACLSPGVYALCA